jgi:hypothetical protein
MKCKNCGSFAINHNLHGRDGSEPELCDVCYWREKCLEQQKENLKLLQEIDGVVSESIIYKDLAKSHQKMIIKNAKLSERLKKAYLLFCCDNGPDLDAYLDGHVDDLDTLIQRLKDKNEQLEDRCNQLEIEERQLNKSLDKLFVVLKETTQQSDAINAARTKVIK